MKEQTELYAITELIREIIANGAQDFTRAALRTSFLASSVSACQSRTMSLALTVQLQLVAFKLFLDLVGDKLSAKDFTEAFDAACFPLTLFSSSFDPGWSSGSSATVIHGLLGMLVEGGANNVNVGRSYRIELSRLFQDAVSSHSWDLAQSLIVMADPYEWV